MTRTDWHTYVVRLQLESNYPGILGVGFSQVIQPAGMQAHITALQVEGFPSYTVRPPGERPLYTSIMYLEPFSDRNLAAFGFEMMSEATRAKAMRLAAETGKTTITAKVQPTEVAQYQALGALDVIAKSFNPMMLATQVNQIWAMRHD